MIYFSNAKINLGLNIINKREDGFHNLETVFYPIGLADVLEVNLYDEGDFNFTQTGIAIDCSLEKNLVYKAYQLIKSKYQISGVNVHLHKIIPFGAGLGGGSSNAAYMLIALNELFNLDIQEETLLNYAAQIGSDCSFFIKNIPCLATGRGEVLSSIDISIASYHLVLIKPNVNVSTKEAYDGIKPSKPLHPLEIEISHGVDNWQGRVVNDFEASVFRNHPAINDIKDKLIAMGAVYAAMSGSGASVFGLFKTKPNTSGLFDGCFVWESLC